MSYKASVAEFVTWSKHNNLAYLYSKRNSFLNCVQVLFHFVQQFFIVLTFKEGNSPNVDFLSFKQFKQSNQVMPFNIQIEIKTIKTCIFRQSFYFCGICPYFLHLFSTLIYSPNYSIQILLRPGKVAPIYPPQN